LNGHVISDVFRNAISTIVMIITGFIIGFRTDASLLDWLTIGGLLLLFTLAFSWVAAIMGVFAKSIEGVQWLTFIIIFPLTFASSAFVPAQSMVDGLRIFAENQPITHFVEAVRALMIGTPIGDHGWLAMIWGIGTLVVAMPLAAWLFKRKTSQ
jgi:ABC-2 type transport system permease protein